jgi:hypothetical protein
MIRDKFINFNFFFLFTLIIYFFLPNIFVNYLYSPLSIPTYSLFIIYQIAHTMDWTSTHLVIFIKFFFIYILALLVLNLIKFLTLKKFLK